MNEKIKRHQEAVRNFLKKEAVRNFLKKAAVLLLWQILILFAMQVDKAYQNGSRTFVLGDIVRFFTDQGHAWGITYDFLYNTLGGFSSILLTVIGMIVSGWINLSDRLEQEVYGIRRKELFSITYFGKITVDFYIGVFCAPVWMVYALLRRYCFTAYFIMAMIFVQFLISNVLLALSYSRSYDYALLRKKILHSQKIKKRINDFQRFDELMDRIGAAAGDISNWSEARRLFFDIQEAIKKDEKDRFCRIGNTFLTKVFGKDSEQLLELIIDYTQEMSRGYVIGDKTMLVYWILLDNVYQSCSEYQVNLYLDKLFDILSLDRPSCDVCENFRLEDIEDIFSMIVLQTECWLQENSSELSGFGGKMGKIFRMGSRGYVSDREQALAEIMGIQCAINRERANLLYRCHRRLVKSYRAGEGQIHMGSLVESIAVIR